MRASAPYSDLAVICSRPFVSQVAISPVIKDGTLTLESFPYVENENGPCCELEETDRGSLEALFGAERQ
jgi:hypothetical protein